MTNPATPSPGSRAPPAAPGTPGPSARHLGYPDRAGFFAEQRRRRRQSAWYGALSALGIALTGLPLSLLLTPAVFAIAAAIVRALPAGSAPTASLRLALLRFAGALPRAMDLVTRRAHVSVADGWTFTAAVALTLLPGFVAALVLWLVVRAAFLRAGAGGILLALRARPPTSAELGELRFKDVVEEMAIAGAMPVPRVLLLDAGAPNAAVVGSGPADATVLMTRAFVKEATRDELQAVAAHLVASAGDGDLRLALTFLSSFATLGLVAAIFDAAAGFSRSAATDVLRTLRWVLGRSRAGDAAEMAGLLTRGLDAPRDDGLAGLMTTMQGGQARTFVGRLLQAVPPLKFLLLPALLLWLPFVLARAPMILTRGLIAEPLVTLVWRARRYLADAMAVQLTRNPDGLASALERLGSQATEVPGGAWADYLFIVTERGGGRRRTGAGDAPRGLGGAGDPHPTVERRVRRLRAMGARPGRIEARPRRLPLWAYLVLASFAVFAGSLLAAALGLAFIVGGGIPMMFTMGVLAFLARVML